MLISFLGRAILAGIGIAAVAGPLGSIMVWRRMTNFGDALAHSTLLGLCFSFLFHLHWYVGLVTVCILVASLLALFSRQRSLAHDTILSMLAYSTLAIGLILATVLSEVRIDLLGYLYGDILGVDVTDLLWIYGIDALVLIVLIPLWPSVLSMTLQEDLAKVEGIPVNAIQWILVLLMAIVFAVAMKLVGILLMTALLIIPASAARQLSKTPEQMAMLASFLGGIAVCLGIVVSSHWDWPTGPAIVVISMGLFIGCLLAGKLRQDES